MSVGRRALSPPSIPLDDRLIAVLDSDHAGLLTNLLRYPSPSPLYPFSPFLIMSQALLLRKSINPTTGVEVVIQNNEVLGVKAQPPVREPEQVKRLPRQPPPRGVQGLAAGLFERAQAAGLDQGFHVDSSGSEGASWLASGNPAS